MSEANVSIIFVPGIRPKPPANEHQAQLRRCLEAAVLRVEGSQQEAHDIARALHVAGWSYGFYGEHAEVHPDMPGIERLLAGQDRPEDDLREAMSFGRRVMGSMHALWDRLPLLTEFFATPRLATQLREVREYFRDQDGAGAAAREQLARALQTEWDAGRQVMLIGHSFGSVIAYDTLWELTHERSHAGVIDLFVSMGSPLTLGYMRRHLKGARKSGAERYPANIRRWTNLAAVGEVTALDRKLASCFKPMVELGLIDSITDNLQLLNQFHGPEGLNVHKCYGYFASRATGELALDWCRQQSAD
jgi:hypothetical protein